MLKHAQRIADAQIWGAGQLLVQPINHSESYYTDYIIKPLKKTHIKNRTVVLKAIHEENPNSHIVIHRQYSVQMFGYQILYRLQYRWTVPLVVLLHK